MRTLEFAVGEYYHLYGRGNAKQRLFRDDRDHIRFLFGILYFQFSQDINNISRQVSYYVKHSVFNIEPETNERIVELVAFCLMPNHFHLIVTPLSEIGVSQYMQRSLNAYAKYFNTKYEASGHVFQGPFGAVALENNKQLLYLSTYLHRNPRELAKEKYQEYPWSSCVDYLKQNRWASLLNPSIVTEQFPGPKAYRTFLEESIAKEVLDEEILRPRAS
jgi:putative transposase